jgi:hypothetical protein
MQQVVFLVNEKKKKNIPGRTAGPPPCILSALRTNKNAHLYLNVFVNVYGSQESITRNRFCIYKQAYVAWRVRQIGCRTGPPGWESIPELLKRFTKVRSQIYSKIWKSILGVNY